MRPDELKRRFGRKIQSLRETRGLTQEQLAGQIGRSVDTVSNIERGVNATRIETALALSKALEVSLPSLFDLESGRAAEDAAIEAIVDRLRSQKADALAKLTRLIDVGLELTESS